MPDIKLKPEIKARWVAALRSGDYTQGQNVLRKQTTAGVQHCCLGVLMEIALEDGIVTRITDDASLGTAIWTDGPGWQLSAMPSSPAVVEWALGSFDRDANINAVSNLTVVLNDGDHSLTGINDAGKHSFSDIADLIEEQL